MFGLDESHARAFITENDARTDEGLIRSQISGDGCMATLMFDEDLATYPALDRIAREEPAQSQLLSLLQSRFDYVFLQGGLDSLFEP